VLLPASGLSTGRSESGNSDPAPEIRRGICACGSGIRVLRSGVCVPLSRPAAFVRRGWDDGRPVGGTAGADM